MNEKKNKKSRRLNKKFIAFFILLLIVLILFAILSLKVRNIYVVGNSLISDQEILEQTNLLDYPKLYKVNTKKIINKIKLIPYIDNVMVTKNLFGRVNIEVSEHKVLLKYELDNSIYLSNLKSIPKDSLVCDVPSLTNYVEESILNDFLNGLNEVDNYVLNKISEITYTPNQYDKDLFLFQMTDGNYVYITTKRLKLINEYTDILTSLNGKKGIMYLDSGNHFEILE